MKIKNEYLKGSAINRLCNSQVLEGNRYVFLETLGELLDWL